MCSYGLFQIMPRNHTRILGSRAYANWANDALMQALQAINAGMSLREAQEKFKIPKSTLQRKIKGKNMGRVGRPTELNSEEEDKLIEGVFQRLGKSTHIP